MSESTKAALAASVAAGYLLGRRRKTKLAMALAAYLASKRLKTGPQELLAMGAGRLGSSPQVSQLIEQLRGEVLDVGRQALKAAADRRLSGFADSLADRTRSLNELLDAAVQDETEEGTEDEEGEEEAAGGREESGRARSRTEQRPARPRRPRRGEAGGTAGAGGEQAAVGRTAGKSAKNARKTAKKNSQKAPARRAPAKKAAGRSAARKPPAEPSPRRR
ncbi:hypothetical protein HCC61_01445 [Streptomyces sp. HNM0575]|uniref:hypothetical protein n=1 Tax=Streptomyces sp. HNM0575 TaxID=2716338 RepID=UPI00145D20FB|nr:hypothetical protein [Streptomyces sp. HNM0575]NLU71373.1 hypothetical protein [Streptomyces sp. HNM0575]